MKKFLIIFLFVPILILASIIQELQNIDKLLEQGKYNEAILKIEELEKKELNNLEKNALNELKKLTYDKLSSLTSINNNTGNINKNETNELESSSLGTVSYPGDVVMSAKEYNKYLEIEKEVLSSKSDEKIYALLKIYINSGLYERAMNLGLKSNDIRNIYISALAARLIGKNEISIKQYNKVLNNNPGHLDSLLGIGIAYRNKKDYANARKYLVKYINSGGTNKNVMQTLEYISE